MPFQHHGHTVWHSPEFNRLVESIKEKCRVKGKCNANPYAVANSVLGERAWTTTPTEPTHHKGQGPSFPNSKPGDPMAESSAPRATQKLSHTVLYEANNAVRRIDYGLKHAHTALVHPSPELQKAGHLGQEAYRDYLKAEEAFREHRWGDAILLSIKVVDLACRVNSILGITTHPHVIAACTAAKIGLGLHRAGVGIGYLSHRLAQAISPSVPHQDPYTAAWHASHPHHS